MLGTPPSAAGTVTSPTPATPFVPCPLPGAEAHPNTQSTEQPEMAKVIGRGLSDSLRTLKLFLGKLKGAAADLASNAKAAARIAAKQVERLRINQVTLPRAHRALGKDMHAAGRYRDDFADIYAQVDGVLARTQSLRQTPPPLPGAQKLTDHAKAIAGRAKGLVKVKAMEMEANSLFRELGRKAFAKHQASSGPASLVEPIAHCLARLEQLAADVRQISESHAGGFLTPRRLLVGGAVAIPVIGLLLIACLFPRGPSLRGSPARSVPHSETANERVEPVFDVPSLLGKDMDGVQAVLGTPTEDDSDHPWHDGSDEHLKAWEKNGVALGVTFHSRSKRVIDFFVSLDDSPSSAGTTDKKHLLAVGNLKEDDPRYRIECVFAVGEPGVYAGAKAIPTNASIAPVGPPPKPAGPPFVPDGVTEVEKTIGGRRVLCIFQPYRTPTSGNIGDLGGVMQDAILEGNRLQERKRQAEASGQYDEVQIQRR
jgi:hypothetical protein